MAEEKSVIYFAVIIGAVGVILAGCLTAPVSNPPGFLEEMQYDIKM